MLQATCPANPTHDRFTTVATVLEAWEVRADGEFLSVSESLQTVHGPQAGNLWMCSICGVTATVITTS